MENTRDSANIGILMAVYSKENGATHLNMGMESIAREMKSFTKEIGNMDNVMELVF